MRISLYQWDPVRCRDHHIIRPLPAATEIDKLPLVKTIQRLGCRIIVRITLTPDRAGLLSPPPAASCSG